MLNYHEMLEKQIAENDAAGVKPKLLLHCCCAPCSSYCLEFLNGHFDITCYFYNPNITDADEYLHRLNELKRFVFCVYSGAFEVIDGGFDPEAFIKNAAGKEDLPEGGERCFGCYRMRLSAACDYAEAHGFDFFATTLTISPHKNAEKLNEIGFSLEKGRAVKYLPGDFKKKGGYARSIQLSKEYGLYRQNYCGCEFSARAAELRDAAKNAGIDK